MAAADQTYPLANLKVLDFSRVLAGPFAGRMLSDLGADVVKVEPPDGDITRLWGKVLGGVPGYYHQQNAGKRDISIDLRAPGAKALVFDLVRKADILIENYRPDVMPRLGLGYEVQIGRASCRERVLWVTGVQTCALPICAGGQGAGLRPGAEGRYPDRELPARRDAPAGSGL